MPLKDRAKSAPKVAAAAPATNPALNSEMTDTGAPPAKRQRVEDGTCMASREALHELLEKYQDGSLGFSAYFFKANSSVFHAKKYNIDRADSDVRCVACGRMILEHPSREAAGGHQTESCTDLHKAIIASQDEKCSTGDLTSITLKGNFVWPTVDSRLLLERRTLVEELWAEVEKALTVANAASQAAKTPGVPPSDPMREARVVIGNPGIGKTAVLSCLLFRCLCPGEYHKDGGKYDRVIVDVPPGGTWCFFVNDPEKSLFTKNVDIIRRPAVGEKVLWLQDTVKDHAWKRRWLGYLYWPVLTVVASSPNSKNYKETKKQVGGLSRYVPTWTWKELKAARSLVPEWNAAITNKELKQRFEEIGGIPRFCFAKPRVYKGYCKELTEAISTFDFETFIEAASCKGDATELANTVLQLVPTENGTYYSLAFHNQRIADRWFAARRQARWDTFATFVKNLLGHAIFRSGSGPAFEYFIREMLCFGSVDWGAAEYLPCPLPTDGALKKKKIARSLVKANHAAVDVKIWRDDVVNLLQTRMHQILLDSTAVQQRTFGALYIPRHPNFVFADFVVFVNSKTTVVLQVTLQHSSHKSTPRKVETFTTAIRKTFGVDLLEEGHTTVLVYIRDDLAEKKKKFKWQSLLPGKGKVAEPFRAWWERKVLQFHFVWPGTECARALKPRSSGSSLEAELGRGGGFGTGEQFARAILSGPRRFFGLSLSITPRPVNLLSEADAAK